MTKFAILFVVLIAGILIMKNIGNSNTVIEEPESSKDQLWVMIEIDDYFRSNKDIEIEEEVIALVERLNLGEVDGHSSGAHQFDFNFYDVKNYERTKAEITKYIDEKYPQLNYVISNDYESIFDKK